MTHSHRETSQPSSSLDLCFIEQALNFTNILPVCLLTATMRNPLLPCFSPLCLAVILLHHMASTVAYTPVDQILLNCGSSGNSTSDARIWIGDVNSKFLTQENSQTQSSLTSTVKELPNVPQVPFTDARLSQTPFTYVFPVTAGQKFVRLYFYPASYSNFPRSNALFSVKLGHFTLLSKFNASLNADADSSSDIIFREYCVNIEGDQRLNITFTPSPDVSNSYAFINGIEILSMPTNLYYSPDNETGFHFIGQQNLFRIENRTSLEMVYRLNVGGKTISPADDTGMFRGWQDDSSYFKEHQVLFLEFNHTIKLNFTAIPQYTAPEDVYRTARTQGNDSNINLSYNLTWQFSVDSGFNYLVRLHFCEFQPEITEVWDRRFRIFIANQTADSAADVILWSGGNGVPVYKDYAVSMLGGTEKKVDLYVAIGAEPTRWKTEYQNAILNGVEIFKISDFSNNLGGPNPDPLPTNFPTIEPEAQAKSSKVNRTTIFAAATGGVAGLILLSILGFLIFWRGKRVKDSGSTDGTPWWDPFSFTTTKSTKTRKSSLPSALSRYFSLTEIKAATNNFDDTFIIGVGGFGNVYKGYIDGGDHPVAIKRLVPGSQQGVHEFKTEIELLSQLRHLHLVSLIGYCNDGIEMILVYDYMARGTLRDHLYKSNNPPLPWKQRLQICIGAARGLSYLHTDAKQTIIHRDVKTTNILLDEEWVAKVSDFGLSKTGPTGVSKAHVSTVVKGSFGYLDPEYYRRQQLTDKSDVYSFGVVLCEVLSARPPILKTAEKKQVSLAEWARQSSRNGKFDQIVDPTLKGQIATECLNKFGEVAVSCLHDSGVERPSMNDVVWGLEFALQLQESIEKVGKHEHVVELEMNDAGKALLPQSKSDDSNNMFSSSGGQVSSIYNSNIEVTMTSSAEHSFSGSNKDSERLVSSGAVFSQILNPRTVKEGGEMR